MSDLPHYKENSPEAEFFSWELADFIARSQARGITVGTAASVAANIAGYIVSAYVHPDFQAHTVEMVCQAVRVKAEQAVGESQRDWDAGRLRPWPEVT